MREAEASASLKHPGIVPVHAVDIFEGKLFFEMGFVEGKTFKSYIQDRRSERRLLLEIFAKICDAVGYAHHRGIIHRDLKPQNVMVDPEDEPHVMDFGLARRVGETGKAGDAAEARRKKRLTQMGAVIGTPVYMPPEQAGGRVDEVDTRSDIYSLGVILYAILTGDLPFRGSSTPETLLMIENDPPPAPSSKDASCPWELERVVLKAIAKARDERYQTAFDLKADIEAWLAGRPVAAVGGGPLYRARKFIARNPGGVALAASALLVAGSFSVYAKRRLEADRKAKQAASAGFVADGKKELDAAGQAEKQYRERRAKTPRPGPDEALGLLGGVDKKLGEARDKLIKARELDPESNPARDAWSALALAQESLKGFTRAEVEEKARIEAEAAARERARGEAQALTGAAADALGAVDPGRAGDAAAVEEASVAVNAARDKLVQAITLDPENAAAGEGLAVAYQKLGALAERRKVFAERERVVRLKAEASAALAKAAGATDDAAARPEWRRSIALLSEARRLDEDDSELKAQRARAGLGLAEVAFRAQQFEYAEHVVEEVKDLDPPAVQAFVDRLRRAREDEGRYLKAVERAELALAAERFTESAAAWQDAKLAAPGRKQPEFGVRLAAGLAAAAEGRYEEALSLYAEAAPFAERAIDKGALERAQNRARSALADAALADARARIRQQRFDDAARAIEKALAIKPDHEDALALKAEVEDRRRAPAGTKLVEAGAFTFGGAGERARGRPGRGLLRRRARGDERRCACSRRLSAPPARAPPIARI